jgi:lipoprotein-anchoring transpeptidase ErfK/SrfK
LTDYYTILSRAVASLEPNTMQARAQLFRRARQLLVERIQDPQSDWTDADSRAEIARFDAAIKRIESDMAPGIDPAGRSRQYQPAEPRGPAPRTDLPAQSNRSFSRIIALGALGLAAFFVVGLGAYMFLGSQPASKKTDLPKTATTSPGNKAIASRPVLDDDLDPGIAGDPSATNLPYYLRRQAVYYRTNYTAGMIVVDRSQRFLYLVQPQSRALRYGIAVGGECDVSAGLYRIKNKTPWPEWSPSASLLKRRNYPPRVAGGPENPLGAYALYLENNEPGIHGTNAPRSIGQAPAIGCFRMVNDDVVDLEKRVPIGTGVVVQN